MIHLSLDLASRQSGWAIFDDEKSGGERLIAYGIIKPRPGSLTAIQRLPIIEKEIKGLLDQYNPKHIIIEPPAGGVEDKKGATNNWLTMSVLFLTHGVVRNEFEKRKLRVDEVSPSTWQNRLSFFKRDRAGRKQKAMEYAVEHYNIPAKSEQDIADAICLFDAYIYLKEWEDRKKEEERSAF